MSGKTRNRKKIVGDAVRKARDEIVSMYGTDNPKETLSIVHSILQRCKHEIWNEMDKIMELRHNTELARRYLKYQFEHEKSYLDKLKRWGRGKNYWCCERRNGVVALYQTEDPTDFEDPRDAINSCWDDYVSKTPEGHNQDIDICSSQQKKAG